MPTPNIKVVSYQVRQVIADDFGETFTEIETRYRVVDADTGEVLDDAQGYGYTSAQKAHRGFAYKQKHHPTGRKNAGIKQRNQRIRAWINIHIDIDWDQFALTLAKDNPDLSPQAIRQLATTQLQLALAQLPADDQPKWDLKTMITALGF